MAKNTYNKRAARIRDKFYDKIIFLLLYILNRNSSDLSTRFSLINSGNFKDIVKPGVYYVAGAVEGKPTNIGGAYILCSPYSDNVTRAGIFIPNGPGTGAYLITCSDSNMEVTKL